MVKSPYHSLPDEAFWLRSVSNIPSQAVDPVSSPRITINKTTRIISAGSCFASNVTKSLLRFGYNYIFTETLHNFFESRDKTLALQVGLGEFSAGYGNIYTPKQMLQTLQRAMGVFSSKENMWIGNDGTFIDPFRPRIKLRPLSIIEFNILQARHYTAVVKAFEIADLLIFTFGLTEAWKSKEDGSIFPVCPGVAGGEFDPERHEFINFRVQDIVRDFSDFVSPARTINKNLKIIITVSPVPLVATATGTHVLTATTYSKSVLRAACQEITENIENVEYFPSYEIICGSHAQFDVFEKDRRNVSILGINHVMRTFFRHIAEDESAFMELSDNHDQQTFSAKSELHYVSQSELIAEALCEEELAETRTRKHVES